MKPIFLEMTAFGSYKEKTSIDFDRFSCGLYLITGDTGAGKTTIFDAIMFALYGTASGPDRTPDMMHCDFADKSVDTEVLLKFRQRDKEYTVRRTIHYRRKRGSAGQFGDAVIQALLQEPDRAPTEIATRVTDRCTELLGLNAEQFRRIVMLAQGEFKEFLQADSDKKNEILGRLFDNSACVRYQNLLKCARDELGKRREASLLALTDALQTLLLPLEGEEREKYLPEHPKLTENLLALTAAKAQRLENMQAERDQCRRREKELAEQKGAAAGHNRLLDELSEKRKRLAELDRLAKDSERRRMVCETAKKAFYQVLPRQKADQAARSALQQAEEETSRLEEALLAQEKAAVKARSALSAVIPQKQELGRLDSEIETIKKSLPLYEELDGKRKELAEAGSKAQKAAEQEAETEKQVSKDSEELKTLCLELEALSGIDAQTLLLEHEYQKAQNDLAALDGRAGIREQAESILQDEKELALLQKRLCALTAEAAEAERLHHGLYQAFIRGQAGILAARLEQELREQGAAVCPVCRTGFSSGQEHAFSPLQEGTPAQAEVEQAKADFQEKEQRRSRQAEAIAKAEEAIKNRKDCALRDAKELLTDCKDWDALTADGYLTAQAARLVQIRDDRKNTWEEAGKKQRRSKELAERKKAVEQRLLDLGAHISRWKESARNHKETARILEAVIDGLQTRLQYADKAAARERILACEKERNALQEQIESWQKEADAAERKLASIRGGLAGQKEKLPELAKCAKDTAADLREALAQSGLQTAEEAAAALLPAGGADVEAWLEEQQDILTEYANDRKNTQKRIEELTEQTKGLSHTDLAGLRKQISQAADACQQTEEACARLEKQLENYRAVTETVLAAKQRLAESEPAWKRLGRRADLAAGTSGEGGKLSFDRYVMGAAFREILEMANRRLNVMSGGKYELLHRLDAGRKNAKAGLEIEVLDMSTGKRRPPASLSGGESFLASLSLALGLSDAVQNHAGGRNLNALFIDEGFGSLDDGTLETALDVLNQLTEGNRLVGIISHVGRLEESIPQKISVKNTGHGSLVTLD